MDIRSALGRALKTLRNSRGLTQEDFSDVSSRTYLSTLERGLKSPTLDKINALAGVIEIHPLSIMVLTYLAAEGGTVDAVLAKVRRELGEVAPE